MGIALDLVTDNIDDIVAKLEQMAPAARRALVRTVRRVTQSAGTQAARDIARRSGVPVRALTQGGRGRGQRVFTRVPPANARTADQIGGSVWVGYNPIAASRVGRLRQDEKGAWARRYYFEDGFLATMRSGYRSIFTRVGGDRLPIEEGKVALTVAEPAMRDIERTSRARLRDVLISELNYELNVRGR